MAHVVLKVNGPHVQFTVDGVDMTPHTMREGFRVEFPPNPVQSGTLVHCVIAADSIETDLADAVLTALRAEPGQ